MRLWHYKLIPFLPNSQLVAQWRELNSIFKKQDNHILINYVYEYPDNDLLLYANLVIKETYIRGIKTQMDNYYMYFQNINKTNITVPFSNHHNNRYLLQCFYNLQEKYDRGQKDFSKEEYERLEEFVKNEIH